MTSWVSVLWSIILEQPTLFFKYFLSISKAISSYFSFSFLNSLEQQSWHSLGSISSLTICFIFKHIEHDKVCNSRHFLMCSSFFFFFFCCCCCCILLFSLLLLTEAEDWKYGATTHSAWCTHVMSCTSQSRSCHKQRIFVLFLLWFTHQAIICFLSVSHHFRTKLIKGVPTSMMSASWSRKIKILSSQVNSLKAWRLSTRKSSN